MKGFHSPHSDTLTVTRSERRCQIVSAWSLWHAHYLSVPCGQSVCPPVWLTLYPRGSLWNVIGDPLLSARWDECIPRLSTFLSAPFTWHSRLSRGSDTKVVCKRGWLQCVECIKDALVKLLPIILFDIWEIVYLLIAVFYHHSLHNLMSPDASGQQQPSLVGAQPHSGASDPGPIRATAPMWRCSRIMHMQRELHPTLLSSLEGIVDQMVWFRENWHEEVRRTGFACLMLLLSGCLSGSDGGKSKTLVVRIYMSLHMCESKLDVGFLHECLTTCLPGQPLFGPVSMCLNTSSLSCCFEFWDFFFFFCPIFLPSMDSIDSLDSVSS